MELGQRRPMNARVTLWGNAADEKAHPPGTRPRLTSPICQAQDLAGKCKKLDNGSARKTFLLAKTVAIPLNCAQPISTPCRALCLDLQWQPGSQTSVAD
jgi:hypothetical protein